MADETQPTVGVAVHAASGTELGSARGFDDDGSFVTIHEGLAGMSAEHERANHEFGEAELMWWYSNYGGMGNLDELPDACPNYSARRK